MAWRLARSLEALRSQLDTAWPDRDRRSDGTIGDTLHAGQGGPTFNLAGYGVTGSDHNPDRNGTVCAYDIDTDIAPGVTAHDIADQIAASGDPRVAFIISNRRIWSTRSGTQPGGWRPYAGSDPHDTHVHVSVRHIAPWVDDTTPWTISAPTPQAEAPKGPPKMVIATRSSKSSWLILDAGRLRLKDNTQLAAWTGAGVPVVPLDDDQIDALPELKN